MRPPASRRSPAALDVAEQLRFGCLADETAAEETMSPVLVDADAQPSRAGGECWTAGGEVQRGAGLALQLDDVLPLRITARREFCSGGDLDGSPDGDSYPAQVLQGSDRRRERPTAFHDRNSRPDDATAPI